MTTAAVGATVIIVHYFSHKMTLTPVRLPGCVLDLIDLGVGIGAGASASGAAQSTTSQ